MKNNNDLLFRVAKKHPEMYFWTLVFIFSERLCYSFGSIGIYAASKLKRRANTLN